MRSASVRFFLITDDDEIIRVAITKFERLLDGSNEEKATKFAGKRVRAAEIVVMVENRKPINVLRAIYYFLHFNENGTINYEKYINDAKVVSIARVEDFSFEKEQRNLINAKQKFAKRQRDNIIWWKPGMELERNILDASIDEFKYKRL